MIFYHSHGITSCTKKFFLYHFENKEIEKKVWHSIHIDDKYSMQCLPFKERLHTDGAQLMGWMERKLLWAVANSETRHHHWEQQFLPCYFSRAVNK
jgi:hypothetical protein